MYLIEDNINVTFCDRTWEIQTGKIRVWRVIQGDDDLTFYHKLQVYAHLSEEDPTWFHKVNVQFNVSSCLYDYLCLRCSFRPNNNSKEKKENRNKFLSKLNTKIDSPGVTPDWTHHSKRQ